MLKLQVTTQFKKDLKKVKKRNLDINKLDKVLQLLQNEQVLAQEYKDHALIGKYTGFRECHIQPDWLLVYAIDKGRLVLVASRTGTHSDLF